MQSSQPTLTLSKKCQIYQAGQRLEKIWPSQLKPLHLDIGCGKGQLLNVTLDRTGS